MKKNIGFFILLLMICGNSYTQSTQLFSQLKTFQQSLSASNLQFIIPKDFKEIKAYHEGNIDVDYAMELPEENFQVWYLVKKSTQQQWPKSRITEDNSKRLIINPDSLYSVTAQYAANQLAGKNFTAKYLPQDILNTFHADKGKSYQLELYDRPETNHFQYGLLLSLQKNGAGFITMLFLSNDNGPDFYKKVNKAYYAVKFN